MLCEQCNKYQATVFFTQIIKGVSTQQHFCQTCSASIFADSPRSASAHWTSYPPEEPKFDKSLERPKNCPTEVMLTDPISVRDLARMLRAQIYQILAVLARHEISKAPDDALDFATASLVCAHYGVTPHRAS